MASSESVAKFKDTLASYCDAASGNNFTKKELGKLSNQNCTGKLSSAKGGFDIAFAKVVKAKGAKVPLTNENAALILNELFPEYKRCVKDATPDAFAAWVKPCVKAGTKTSATGGVDRMTDTSKYTGAHKERFDESGKGKGIKGREDIAKNDGYVGAYKEKGTYDKKH